MANPVPVTYNAAASPVAGGRYVWPEWRRGRAPMSVFAIPASNLLSDLNPRYNPELNPVYPSKPEWDGVGGHASVTGAWCGGCYGDEVGELWLPLSGGHADYAGNEPYKINLLADVPQWEMVRPPSGAIGNVLTTNDAKESSGVYADGRPRAVHSYNRPVWIDGVGPSISIQGSTSWSGQSGPHDFLQIDRFTGEATRTVFSSFSVGGLSGLGACYDSTRHAIWARGVGTAYFYKLDIATKTWAIGSAYKASSGYYGLCHIPGFDVIFALRESATNPVEIMDCLDGSVSRPNIIGETAATLDGRMQPRWVPELNSVAVWNNEAASAHKVTLLSPSGNPKTDPWTASTLEFLAVDQPTGMTQQGTYGRFFYSKKLGGFGVLNRTTEPMYFFAVK